MACDTDLSLTRDSIKRELVNFGCQNAPIHFFSLTDSTNKRAREYMEECRVNITEPHLFIADSQSAGRGRLGRRFESRSGVGVYMSIILPLSVDNRDISTLTAYAAHECAEAIEELTGGKVSIKWVNDLYHGGRKLAGILTECVISPDTGSFAHAVIGIGINVLATEFSDEVRDIATDIETEYGVRLSRARLAASIFKRVTGNTQLIGTAELIEKYKSRSFLIGERVTVFSAGEEYPATVLDIDADAALIVKDTDGKLLRLTSGEVSVRQIINSNK